MLPFLALILFMAVTSGKGGTDSGAYDNATKWAENGFGSYEMTYTITVAEGIELGPTTVEVQEGVLVDYQTSSPQLEDAPRHTVESLLFAIEDQSRGTTSDVADVAYDEDLGYPTAVSFDPDLSREGDEWSIEVTALNELAGAGD